jgi:hypothetical protein
VGLIAIVVLRHGAPVVPARELRVAVRGAPRGSRAGIRGRRRGRDRWRVLVRAGQAGSMPVSVSRRIKALRATRQPAPALSVTSRKRSVGGIVRSFAASGGRAYSLQALPGPALGPYRGLAERASSARRRSHLAEDRDQDALLADEPAGAVGERRTGEPQLF